MFTHGLESRILKASNETEENMKTVEIKENTKVASYHDDFIDSKTRKKSFKDAEGKEIFSYLTEILPVEKYGPTNTYFPSCRD